MKRPHLLPEQLADGKRLNKRGGRLRPEKGAVGLGKPRLEMKTWGAPKEARA